MKVSSRLLSVPSSPIRKLVPLAVDAKKNGVTVFHLNIGDPDIKTPDSMLRIVKHWTRNPIGYSQSQGEPDFLEAMRKYYHSLGFSFLKTSDIQATIGGSEAISMAIFATVNPGEEILVFEPFYTNYNSYAAINGVKLVPVETEIAKGFHLPSKNDIEKRISKKTRAILFCNPNNPTGTVYTKKEIEILVHLAVKYKLFLLSDETYREYTYDGRKQISLLGYMEKIPKQAVILDSLSKRYSLCGIRVGALISKNEDIMAGVLRIAQGRLSAGLIDQTVAANLMNVPKKYLEKVREEYKKRRDVVFEGLRKIAGVVIPKPEGAFYTIVGLPVRDSDHFCRWLLTNFRDDNQTVMLAPAYGFYATKGKGKNEVRLAYVLNTKSLKRSVEILEKALKSYNEISTF